MKRVAITALLALFALMALGAGTASAYYRSAPSSYTAPSTTPTTVMANATETALLALLNKDRAAKGLKPLQLDTALTNAARAKSKDMASRGYFSHTSPVYGSPAQLLSRFGIRYLRFGENIAKGSIASHIHSMWMNSAAHRANILNPAFTHVGVGTVPGYATELFVAR